MNGLSAEQLAEAITAQGLDTTPLSAQETVKLEVSEWGNQWAMDEVYEELQWPEEANHPPSDLTVQKLRDACMTFPDATGLSWDALHPRALCRLSDRTLAMIITILARAERTGNWPEAVELVIIVLLPKSGAASGPSGSYRGFPGSG